MGNMPLTTTSHASIAAVVAAVPSRVIRLDDETESYGGNPAQLERLKKTIGLSERRVVDEQTTTADLCLAAARDLIAESSLAADAIDAIIFVTQTPDYPQPCNAALLHRDLGCRPECAAFDVNLGCSGYVYGLWLGHLLVESGGYRNVLLLAGDTVSRIIHPNDRALAPLFGDGGSATWIRREETGSTPAHFEFFTDGSGYDSLIVPAGGFRRPSDADTAKAQADTQGNLRTLENLHMDGAAIFSFTISQVPKAVEKLLIAVSCEKDAVDAYVFHQANRYILGNIAKRLGIPFEKVPMATVEHFGNQSSASIPTALLYECAEQLAAKQSAMRLVLCGFGVGLSWGTALIELKQPERLALIDYHSA
jgi:3-oxoacyl-[acyl-carrier-protein] synthase-3